MGAEAAHEFFELGDAVLGLGVGPYTIGLISDATGNLRVAMLSINVVAIPIVLLMVLIARRSARDEAALLDRAAG